MSLANYVPKSQMSSGPCGPIFVVGLINDCTINDFKRGLASITAIDKLYLLLRAIYTGLYIIPKRG